MAPWTTAVVPALFATMSEVNSPALGGIAAILVLGAVAAGVWHWTAERAPEATTPNVTAPAQPKVLEPVQAEAPAPPPPAMPAQKPAGTLRYAGGQSARALNGVTQDVRLDWEGPWSPIARTVVDQGWEWYVHEDGSYSTTRMIDMNGVPQAMALRAQPTAPLPVLDDAALKAMMQQRR